MNLTTTPSSLATPALSELYQEVIMEHSRRPRHKGKPEAGCQFCQEGKNPLCGDHITLFCSVLATGPAGAVSTGEPRLSLAFEGTGCSISQASASMLCDAVQGLTPTRAREVLRRAEDVYTGRASPSHADDIEEDVEALFGVSKFPVRVKCAALPWKTFEIILGEKFDSLGFPKDDQAACAALTGCAREKRVLRIVSTED